MDLDFTRELLEKKLSALTEEEDKITQELQYHFSQLIGRASSNPADGTKQARSTNPSIFDNFNIANDLNKLKNFEPVYESVEQNAKRLATQVEECNALSERLSQIVRKLDLKQARAQKALACTEDILSLKDCKHKILQAIEAKDLASAVNSLKHVHEINEKAAKTSEDYEIIVEKEKEVKEMVRNEFQKAITESDTSAVMALCPLLQTLGLEAEARDNFLTYMESKVFIAVSADAAVVEGATDPSTAYAQTLSNVFNSTCLIIQQYLPMVIQGLENSLGDVYFIRLLHKRCEQEAGLVLKRYMKYRKVKEIIHNLSSKPTTSSSQVLTSPGNPNSTTSTTITPAEMHTLMNELALLIQYCCKYLKYLRNVCQGAENKIRTSIPHPSVTTTTTTSMSTSSNVTDNPNHTSNNTITTTAPVIVFSGPLEFDKMVDELINKYYMEGEQWLMSLGMKNVLPKSIPLELMNITKTMKLDECFFVLQKCGLRSIASHNIHAACACLTMISDLISNDLLNQGMEMLLSSINKISTMIQEYIQRYRKRMMILGGSEAIVDQNQSGWGFSSAMSLASTIAGGSNATSDPNNANTTNSVDEIIFHEDGTFTIPSLVNKLADGTYISRNEEDRWGVASLLEAFNVLELCIRYTERLSQDLYIASQNIFMTDEDEIAEQQQQYHLSLATTSRDNIKTGATRRGSNPSGTTTTTTTTSKYLTTSKIASDFDKIKLCKENFDNIRTTYTNALRQSAERFVTTLQPIVKEILSFSLTKQGVYGGLKFDEKESIFDQQPILILLPKILTLPLETMIQMSTHVLSEKNKDLIVHFLADHLCERLEQLIYQTRFSLSGALKMEEYVRVLNTLFNRHSSIPLRGKFSRLREILMILTSERLSDVLEENHNHFTHLLHHEIETIYQFRVDGKP